jgi:hypothetical protein
MGGLDAHFQGSLVHNGDSATALLPAENDALGNSDAYTLAQHINQWENRATPPYSCQTLLIQATACLAKWTHNPATQWQDFEGKLWQFGFAPGLVDSSQQIQHLSANGRVGFIRELVKLQSQIFRRAFRRDSQ